MLDCVARSSSDRKSTRLNSSHLVISYAVFCLKKKNDEAGTGLIALAGVLRHDEGAGLIAEEAAEGCGRTIGSSVSFLILSLVFFFNDTATTEIYSLSLHDALPICFSDSCLSNDICTFLVKQESVN